MSPRVFLEDLRLKTALTLLYNEHLSIKETAGRCGFYDANYFCCVFKKRFGVTARSYRERDTL